MQSVCFKETNKQNPPNFGEYSSYGLVHALLMALCHYTVTYEGNMKERGEKKKKKKKKAYFYLNF